MKTLVVTKFHGTTHFSLLEADNKPRQKDERWKEIYRVPVPDGLTLAQAAALWRAGELKKPEPPAAKERPARADRTWDVPDGNPAFPTYTDDSKRDMDWDRNRPNLKEVVDG